MHILELPNDILRLIIKEIPDAKGFHSLAISNRLFCRLCLLPAIQKHVKQKYLITRRLDYPADYIIQQQYPNGVKHGTEEYYVKSDNSLYCRCFNVNGYREGPRLCFDRSRIIQKSFFKKGQLEGLVYNWDSRGFLNYRRLYDQGTLLFSEVWPEPNWYEIDRLREPSWLSLGMKYYSSEQFHSGILVLRSYHNRWLGVFFKEEYNQNAQFMRRQRYIDVRWRLRQYAKKALVPLILVGIYCIWRLCKRNGSRVE